MPAAAVVVAYQEREGANQLKREIVRCESCRSYAGEIFNSA